MDASTLGATEQKNAIQRHDVAECVLRLDRAIACDLAEDIAATSRFVIVDDFEIRGGGIVGRTLALLAVLVLIVLIGRLHLLLGGTDIDDLKELRDG